MLEPIEATRHVLRALSRTSGHDLERWVRALAREVTALVPSCVGVSITMVEQGLTFTLVASSESAAALDAVQYLQGGPCVDTSFDAASNEVPDALSEERWHHYAMAAAAEGVRSSLSLPVDGDGGALGAVNIYASAPDAFAGSQEAIRALLRSGEGEAVLNADLSFRTRARAEEAPAILAERDRVEQAVGFLAAAHGVDLDHARALLHEAAQRGGVGVTAAARRLLAADDASPDV